LFNKIFLLLFIGTNCRKEPRGTSYAGTMSTTRSGKKCQAWSAQLPHIHLQAVNAAKFPGGRVYIKYVSNLITCVHYHKLLDRVSKLSVENGLVINIFFCFHVLIFIFSIALLCKLYGWCQIFQMNVFGKICHIKYIYRRLSIKLHL
jgi:hypothetical protein